MHQLKIITFIVVLLLACGCASSVPDSKPVDNVVWLEQNWTSEQRYWFHNTTQGTATFPIPFEWFMALEQPRITFFGSPGLLSDEKYLSGFGFIPGQKNKYNPYSLPVGFAVDKEFVDPVTQEKMNAIGFTCAACHTGQITYKGTAILTDGGPATTALGKFRKDLGLSLAYTKYVPFRFGRFADRVLGKNHSDEDEDELKQQLEKVLQKGKELLKLSEKVEAESVEEGFMRLDALNRIGNQVFAISFDPANYVPTNAPVNFPHIWSTSWFDWVQYDSSIKQPMMRNAGEALGVTAMINLKGPKEMLFESTIKVKNLYDMERQLSGEIPPTKDKKFHGLLSPKWPEDILGAIDESLAKKGEKLYMELCKSCHLPPVKSEAFWESQYWTPTNAAGEQYLKVPVIPITHIGTDPMQAKSLADRVVNTEGLGLGTNAYGPALGALVEKAVKRWYDSQEPPTSPEMRERMNGNRPNELRAEMEYRARPLNGIWATPPYLHNGSVPNLYFLLSPWKERPKTFYLGHLEFDPKNVGLEYGKLSGGFKLDTTIKGNSNRGHEFDNGPKGNGIIGRYLSSDERMALIEFLKTL